MGILIGHLTNLEKIMCAYQDTYIMPSWQQHSLQYRSLFQIIFTSEYGSRVPLNFRKLVWFETVGAKKIQNKLKKPQKNQPSMDDSHPCLVDFSGVFFNLFWIFFAPTVSDQTSFSKVKGNHGTIPINENTSGQDLYWGLCCQLLYVAYLNYKWTS